MSDQTDLFAATRQADLDRLRALGWEQTTYFGTEYWKHPQTGTWSNLDMAPAWPARRDQEQAGGGAPENEVPS